MATTNLKNSQSVVEDNVGRHSFNGRICDDLCEEILKYLSFADKIQLQCVCRRFSRTIFNKQTKIFVKYRYCLID